MAINCFDGVNLKIGDKTLEQLFKERTSGNPSELELIEIGTDLAMQYHESLFNELETLRKAVNPKAAKGKYQNPFDKAPTDQHCQPRTASRLQAAAAPSQADNRMLQRYGGGANPATHPRRFLKAARPAIGRNPWDPAGLCQMPPP